MRIEYPTGRACQLRFGPGLPGPALLTMCPARPWQRAGERTMPPRKRPAARRSGSKRFGPYLARWQVLFALAFGTLVAIALVLELTAPARTLAWAGALRLSSGGAAEKLLAVARLERLGEAGMPLLLLYALDPTPVPLDVEEGREYAMLALPDSVCDKALDALRRMREGPDAARAFEWEAVSGKSHAQALHEFRRAELDKALEWWKARQAARLKARREP